MFGNACVDCHNTARCFWPAETPSCAELAASRGSAKGPGSPASPPRAFCWKQVGISQAVMEEQRSIQRESCAQVEAGCGDSSFSEQQKRAKIQEIRKAEHERLMSLILARQREELKQCQLANQRANPHAGLHTGSCGGQGTPPRSAGEAVRV